MGKLIINFIFFVQLKFLEWLYLRTYKFGLQNYLPRSDYKFECRANFLAISHISTYYLRHILCRDYLPTCILQYYNIIIKLHLCVSIYRIKLLVLAHFYHGYILHTAHCTQVHVDPRSLYRKNFRKLSG